MKFYIISDTHGEHAKLGRLSGDVLIHCGDFAIGSHNEEATLKDLDHWFGEQAFGQVICVGGNHDFLVEEKRRRGEPIFRNAVCLQDELLEVGGIRFYGAPWVPELTEWAHFLAPVELQRAWQRIPQDLDVLITHTPPRGIRDLNSRGQACGCELLRERVLAVRPRVHCFGHIHASAGTESRQHTHFVNAASVNSQYKLSREPVVVHIDHGKVRVSSSEEPS